MVVKNIFNNKMVMIGLIAYAGMSNAQQGIEWVLDGGVTWFHSPHTTISPTDFETDKLSKGQANATGDLGLGVYHKQPLLMNGSAWFNTFGFGLALRYSGFSDNIAKGTVEQFEQTNLDNYRYQLHFANTRLLAQFTLDVLTYQHVSLYLMGGVGEGWSRLRYQDFPNTEDLGGGLSLPTQTTSRLVSDVGVGINYNHTSHLSYSLSYLYTDYGHIAANSHGNLNHEPVKIVAPSFSIDSQALLVGIHYLA